jgi:hypothetical protein
MIRFKQFLNEAYVRPQFGINEPTRFENPLEGRPLSIFTQSAGYGRDWNLPTKYNPRGDALVHTTEFFPQGGIIQTRGSAESNIPQQEWGMAPKTGRETVHFTRNGLVSSHMAGNFEERPFTVVSPQGPISSRLVAHADQDSWVLGNVEIPNGSTIMVHEPALSPEQKNNLAQIFGAKNYEEIQQRLQKGSNLDFNGRQIELKTTKGNIQNSVDAHLRSVGVEPLNIGQDYAIGLRNSRSPEKLPSTSRDQSEWFAKQTKERLGSIETPFGTVPHADSEFSSSERMKVPPVPFYEQNPEEWSVPEKSLEDVVRSKLEQAGRELHPEEQSAIERNKEWRRNLNSWIEDQKTKYSANPNDYVEQMQQRNAAEVAERAAKRQKVSNLELPRLSSAAKTESGVIRAGVNTTKNIGGKALRTVGVAGEILDPMLSAGSRVATSGSQALGLGAEVASGMAMAPLAIGMFTQDAGDAKADATAWLSQLPQEQRDEIEKQQKQRNAEQIQSFINQGYNPSGKSARERTQ